MSGDILQQLYDVIKSDSGQGGWRKYDETECLKYAVSPYVAKLILTHMVRMTEYEFNCMALKWNVDMYMYI